jgi:hypothetical protein
VGAMAGGLPVLGVRCSRASRRLVRVGVLFSGGETRLGGPIVIAGWRGSVGAGVSVGVHPHARAANAEAAHGRNTARSARFAGCNAIRPPVAVASWRWVPSARSGPMIGTVRAGRVRRRRFTNLGEGAAGMGGQAERRCDHLQGDEKRPSGSGPFPRAYSRVARRRG